MGREFSKNAAPSTLTVLFSTILFVNAHCDSAHKVKLWTCMVIVCGTLEFPCDFGVIECTCFKRLVAE